MCGPNVDNTAKLTRIMATWAPSLEAALRVFLAHRKSLKQTTLLSWQVCRVTVQQLVVGSNARQSKLLAVVLCAPVTDLLT